MTDQTYSVEIEPGRRVTVRAGLPAKNPPRALVVLAHGMNNDLDFPLMVEFARRLAQKDLAAVRFNFLYREEGRSNADNAGRLIACMTKVMEDARDRFTAERMSLVLGGKSLGARISATIAGQDVRPDALVYLGFPLQPPGRPDRGREAVILNVGDVPQFFAAGTRDPLCPLDRLKKLLPSLPPQSQLYTVEGGDHSFHVPKKDPRSQEEVDAGIAEQATAWLLQVLNL
jgi:predicted alpha/beta-hydrolase family hydrolase